MKGDIYIRRLICVLMGVNRSRLPTGNFGCSALDAMNMSRLCRDACVVCFSLKYVRQSSSDISSSILARRHITS